MSMAMVLTCFLTATIMSNSLFTIVVGQRADLVHIFHQLKVNNVTNLPSKSLTQLSASRSAPDFCHNLDCPSFTVLNKTESYEERSYVKSVWVSTTLTGIALDPAVSKMFFKLFDYIQGNNAKRQKIDMTVPVLISIIPGPGPACESNFTMSFFVSPKVGDPPKPTDATVFLSQLPEQRVFVRSFGGFATQDSWLKNAELLGNDLQRDSKAFIKDYFYAAGYNSPFEVLGRHNEIWFIAQN